MKRTSPCSRSFSRTRSTIRRPTPTATAGYPWPKCSYAKTKSVATYTKAGTILTEHATLDDGREGKFAATLYLESDKAQADKTAKVANPELRALLEQQQSLQKQIDDVKLKKDVLPAAQYDQQMEKLLTELAVKARAIRQIEARQ